MRSPFMIQVFYNKPHGGQSNIRNFNCDNIGSLASAFERLKRDQSVKRMRVFVILEEYGFEGDVS